jgi:hypothetical protein
MEKEVRRVMDVDQPSQSIKEAMPSGKVLFYDWQINYFETSQCQALYVCTLQATSICIVSC